MTSRVYIEIDTALTEALNDPDAMELERTEALRESELLRMIRRIDAHMETLEPRREGAPILEVERERQALFRDLAHDIGILGRKAGIRALIPGTEDAPLFPRAYARIKKEGRQITPMSGDILTYRDVLALPIRALEVLLRDVIPYSMASQPIGKGEPWDALIDRQGETRAYLMLALIEWSRVLEDEGGREWLRERLEREREYLGERLAELSEEWEELKKEGKAEGIRDPVDKGDQEGRGMFGLRGVRIP